MTIPAFAHTNHARKTPLPVKTHAHHGSSGRDEHGYLTHAAAKVAIDHWMGELRSKRSFIKAIAETGVTDKITVITFVRTTVQPANDNYSLDNVQEGLNYWMAELEAGRIKLKLTESATDDAAEDILTLVRYHS